MKSGELAEEEVNKHVRRVSPGLMYNLKSIDSTGRAKGNRDYEQHFKEAYNIASESVVLLKNEKNMLPLELKRCKKHCGNRRQCH